MSRVSTWEAEQAVRDARRAQDRAADAYDAQLTALLEEYAGRRSVAAELVRQVADLAVGHAAEADRRADQRVETLTAGHAAVIERLEERTEIYKTLVEQLKTTLTEKRTLLEERAQQGEEVKVTIGRSLGGWQVADLEEVAYRLRCGGAFDETPVKVTDWTASALVPAPNLVPLTRPDRTPQPQHRPEPLPDPEVPDGGGAIHWGRVLVAALVVAYLVLALVVVL